VAAAEPTKIGDLMAALEASVAAAREARREVAAGAKADEDAPTKAEPRQTRRRKTA
jgi:non-homologous end joining protein Ku